MSLTRSPMLFGTLVRERGGASPSLQWNSAYGPAVDVVDPRVVLGVVDVGGRGNHEAGAGDQLQRVGVVDRVVVRAVREHDHGKGLAVWIDRRVLARDLGLDYQESGAHPARWNICRSRGTPFNADV